MHAGRRTCSTTARSRCSVPTTTPTSSAAAGPAISDAADELRRREAVDVVGAITTALRDGWTVVDDDTRERRPCRPGDICVLLPTRLSLPALEAELRSIEVPYRAENASVVYATAEVRDLLMALRAADDPTDELALVAALRSPLYGCSDVELYDWKRRGGSWSLLRQPPDDLADHPVADAIGHLRSIHQRIPYVGAADLLERDRRRAAGARRGARWGRCPRRLAAAPVRDRSGPGLGRRRRPRHSALPGVGAPPGVRRRGSPRRFFPNAITMPCGS